jgi:adenylate cyclase
MAMRIEVAAASGRELRGAGAPPGTAAGTSGGAGPERASDPVLPGDSWFRRHPLIVVGAAPLLPMLIGSAINIWYNLTQIEPLLTPAQRAIFVRTIAAYNVTAYPVLTGVWIWLLLSLRHPYRDQVRGRTLDPARHLRAQRLVINLPWWGVGLAALGVALCVPVFLLALARGPDPVAPVLYTHLPVSFAISGLVPLTQVFFVIEILSQRLLYPVFFRESRPVGTPGTLALSLRGRGLLLAMSAGVCPVLSLLLLSLVPPGSGHDVRPFAMAVGGLGIALGLGTAWLLGRLVTEPVAELERATRAVTAGDLDVRIATLRADEFGLLIDGFNTMVAEMREKRRVEESFGRHVGARVARHILARDGGPGGAEQELTVMFADIRGFTARAEASTPSQLVALLNMFLTEMVEVIEQGHGGIVNKFLGDGLMALFGEWTGRPDHADAALAAGREMLARVERLNRLRAGESDAPLAIGIGIHTGRAVVGSIGSPRRLEYTAIGDTVNVASRVESLTKGLGVSLLITGATRRALRVPPPLQSLSPQHVPGYHAPVEVLRLAPEARGPSPEDLTPS